MMILSCKLTVAGPEVPIKKKLRHVFDQGHAAPQARFAGIVVAPRAKRHTQCAALANATVGGTALESRIDTHCGTPWLFVNGEPAATHWAFCSAEHAADFTAAGIGILTFSLPPAIERQRWWLGPEEYDFTTTRVVLERFAAVAPDAVLVPRIHFGYAEMSWWPDLFPEECAVALRIEDGQPDTSFQPRGVRRLQHSMASQRWRELAGKALAALVQDCERQFGERILGYHVGGGHTAEWFTWNVVNPDALDDYSEPMRRAFREFLRKTYRTDEALRRAWHREDVALETAEIPSPRRRASPEAGGLYDPSTSRDIIDYQRCYGEETAASAIYLCRVAKESVAGRKVVGVFGGYLMTFDEVLCPQRNGHLGFATVLESPDVDFICSPYLYENRGWGGFHHAQSLPMAVAAHGKLYVDEVDTPPLRDGRRVHQFTRIHRPCKPDEWAQVLRRDYAHSAAMGAARWWMDLINEGWYSDEASTRTLRTLVEAEQRMAERPRGPVAEIAVVLDIEAHCAAAPGPSLQEPFIGFLVQWELPRIGAPFDVVLLDDLLTERCGPYRLLLFPQLGFLGADKRTRLREYLDRTGTSAFWFHAPGWLDENGPCAENVRDLTGLAVRVEGRCGHLDAEILSNDHWLTQGLEPGTAYGSSTGLAQRQEVAMKWEFVPQRIGPRVALADGDARPLAVLKDGGEPALAVKESEGRFDLLSVAPAPPPRLLRNAAGRAGVHLYAPLGDIVYAGKHFLGIVAGSDGTRAIRLPTESRVTELTTGATLLEQGREFELDLMAHHCGLFLVED